MRILSCFLATALLTLPVRSESALEAESRRKLAVERIVAAAMKDDKAYENLQ